MLLSRLECISPPLQELLLQQNIKTVEDFIFADRKLIAERIKVDANELEHIASSLEQQFTPIPTNASTMLSELVTKDASLFSTGSESIDKILGGGLFTGQLLELVGGPATGKTQLCICASVLAATDGASVAYIDSSNTFPPQRFMEVYVARQLGGQEGLLQKKAEKRLFDTALANIKCFKAFDVFSLLETLDKLEQNLGPEPLQANQTVVKMRDYCSKLKLIIVDSIASLIGPLLGKQQQNLGHAVMTSVARTLKHIANRYHIAVVFTNYTVSGDDWREKKAGLGQSWTYVPTTQLFLHHDLAQDSRHAIVTKCPHTPSGYKAFFKISEMGIMDC